MVKQLTVKTLKHEKIDVEVDDDATTLDIKKAVFAKRPDLLVEGQKIVFSGKVLADDSVPSFGPTEFMVVMYRKPTGAPDVSAPATSAADSAAIAAAAAAAPPPAATAAQLSAAAIAAAAAAAPPPAATAETPATATGARRQRGPQSTPAEVAPADLEERVANIVSMGFPRDTVLAALRYCQYDPNVAVNLLLSGEGVPEPLMFDGGVDASEDDDGEEEEEEGADDEDLEDAAHWLRQHPQLNQFRALIQSNPALLEPFLQNIAQAEPAIFDWIRNHQEEFSRIMNEPVDPSMVAAMNQAMAERAQAQPGQGGGGGAQNIQVTPQERDAIERLVALGFDRGIVIQAYFACDRDENVTANYLLEHGHEFQ